MRSRFKTLTKAEISFIEDNVNLLQDEISILELANKGYSDIYISGKLLLSVSSIGYKKRKMIERIVEMADNSKNATVIYINGEKVSREELGNYEIKIEEVTEIIKRKLTE